MQLEPQDESLLGFSVGQAARILGVSIGTLRRWTDEGIIPHVRTPGGQRRYRLSDLQQLANKWSDPKNRPS